MAEWNRRFQEWNGKQYSIPDFVHCIFRKTYRYTCILYGFWVVIDGIVGEEFHFHIYAHYLWTNCGTLIVFFAQTVYALYHSKYIAICNIDVICRPL